MVDRWNRRTGGSGLIGSLKCFGPHERLWTGISVIMRPIQLKPSSFARLDQNYMLRVSLKISSAV